MPKGGVKAAQASNERWSQSRAAAVPPAAADSIPTRDGSAVGARQRAEGRPAFVAVAAVATAGPVSFVAGYLLGGVILG